MGNITLKKELTALVHKLRHSVISPEASLLSAQSAKEDFVNHDGRTIRRKRILLLTPRCAVASCTMCPLPNEAIDPKSRLIAPENIIQQFENAFSDDKLDDYDWLTVYNNGNFFADQEINEKITKNLIKFLMSLLY